MSDKANSSGSTLDDDTSATVYDGETTTDKVVLAAAYRKIDWAILPLMFLCYFLQFLDKVLINYANIMGLAADLKFRGNDFSWMATAFFIAFAVAEAPQGYLIQRFPVGRVLGINVMLWGVIVCSTAAVKNFTQIMVLRIMLGACEAVIAPALIMMTSQWYTRQQATPRTGLWYCGMGAGQSLGGLISWAAQHGPQGHGDGGAGLVGWRIMFLSVGCFNLAVGLVVALWIPSSVDEAQRRRLISTTEARAVGEILSRDQGKEAKVFRSQGIWEALSDAQVWLLFFNALLIVVPSGVITSFSATLIRGFGYDSKAAALLNMPSGAVSVTATLLGTFAIRCNFPRWAAICLMMVPAMIGAALMSFGKSQPAALAGIYMINFVVAPLALVYALVASNTQGYTKRVTTSAVVAVGFSIANIIGPQTFQAKDAPDYLPAKVTVFGVCGGTMVVTLMLRVLYGIRNRRVAGAMAGKTTPVGDATRVRGGIGAEADSGSEPQDLTDRTNPNFHYVY